ncbi:MAG TPA: hypothetical protein VG435_05400 [Acidimicrobiales bacterium]|jgi:D-glycero-alpha-D-manno-heptose-7-phosphate kinase|nr:hypothetical protein [Acidimicrobiales bacterium]
MIEVTAPVRICDLGGWTDTWFGGPGRVLNFAVEPGVEITLAEIDDRPGQVRLDLRSFSESYLIHPGQPRPARHPFIEAAVDLFPPEPAVAHVLTVRSDVPPGSGTGTSAAVIVGVIAALARARAAGMGPDQVAYAAHRVESEVLGGQSGIQDQMASAHGGILFLGIDDYPRAEAEHLPAWAGLGDLMTLVYLGRAHSSSDVHEQVIADAGGSGQPAFEQLRRAAIAGRRAVLDRDVEALGRAMLANSEGQERLHRSLVGQDARTVIPVAAATGAVGWKVNGAGGDGGSLVVLHRRADDKDAFAARLAALSNGYATIPIRVCSTGAVVSPGGESRT